MVFDFLKKIFNLSKVREEKVFLDDIGKWFDRKVEEKEEKLNEKAEEYLLKVKNRFDKLKEAEKKLKEKEVPEVKVEDKIKQVVLSNRKNYLKSLSKFIDVDFPEVIDIKEIYDFHSLLKEKLDKFGEETVKSYNITQHLFYDEVEEIAGILKEISKDNSYFDKVIEKHDYSKIDDVRKKVKELKKLKEKKGNLKNEIKEKEVLKDDIISQIHKKEKEIKEIKGKEQYKNYEKLKKKEERLKNKKSNLKEEVESLFSKLERVLKKYNNLNPSSIIDDYLESPFKTLKQDKNLEIATLIKEMNYNLDKLNFDEEEGRKTKDLLDKVSKEKLRELRDKLKEVERDLRIVIKKKVNNQARQQIEEEEYKIRHFREKIGQIEEEKEDLEDLKEKIDLESKKEEVKESLKEVGYRVKFS